MDRPRTLRDYFYYYVVLMPIIILYYIVEFTSRIWGYVKPKKKQPPLAIAARQVLDKASKDRSPQDDKTQALTL